MKEFVTTARVAVKAGMAGKPMPDGKYEVLTGEKYTVVASVVFGLILGAIAKWAERSEHEEPVEAVEPERVKTYPPYEKTS